MCKDTGKYTVFPGKTRDSVFFIAFSAAWFSEEGLDTRS